MPIRMARLEDIPALVEGGRRMHALTRFRHFDYLPEKVARSFEAIIREGHNKYVFMVAENGDGQVVGSLIGVLEQHIFSDELIASVMHFDVFPWARMGGYGVRLLLAFEKWARMRGVIEVMANQNSASCLEEVSMYRRFLTRMGYVEVGSACSKLIGC